MSEQPDVEQTTLVSAEQQTIPAEPSEAPPDSPKLNPSDIEADSDLSRPARAAQFRVQRRTQISTAIPALLLIALGIVYLIDLLSPEALALTRPLAVGIGVTALGGSLVLRFLLNGRRERGLFFIGAVILLWIGLGAASLSGDLAIEQAWPLAISAIGVGMIITYLFERSHDRGLLMPALIVILFGALILPFTLGMLPPDIMSLVALYWPVVLIILAMALLPRAIRDRTQ